MLRGGEDVSRLAPLDDLAIGHDADPVGHLPHDAEIVGDEQHRHVELGLELEQQVEDLRLDRHVERGRRLVGDERSGSLASAMAIMTRWRCPPESWCG